MKSFASLILALFCTFQLSHTALAQGDGGFDRDQWEKLRSGLDYTEDGTELEALEQNQGRTPSFVWGILLQVLRYGGIIALVIGLIILIVKILGGVRFRKKSSITTAEAAEDVQLHIPSSLEELEAALRSAVSRKDFKEAIRIQYQISLKHLLVAGVVREAPDKTNWEYALEIADQRLSGQFARLTAFFEYIWFGEGPANQASFETGRAQFDQFIQNIPREPAK